MAWSSPLFTRAGAVLVGSHDGRVDHRIFVVGVVGQGFEKTLPNAAFGPARKALVGVFPVAEALGQIAPRRARTELPDHSFDKQPVAAITVAANRARTAWQKFLDPCELAFMRSASSLQTFQAPPIRDSTL